MNVLIESVNSAGARWAAWVVATSLDAAVLLALVGLVWLAIRRRVAPELGYWLFLLVAFKLLMPVSVTVPGAVAQWVPSFVASSWFNVPRVDRLASALPVEGATIAVESNQAVTWRPSSVSPSQAPPVRAASHEPSSAVVGRSLTKEPRGANGRARSDSEAPNLSPWAIAMIAWLICVLSLLTRLARTQVRFQSRLRLASPIDDSKLGVNLRELCHVSGVRQSIRFLESDCVAAPSVWGIAGPAIILPPGIAAALTTQQLRWVLLHELTHIRRLDLLVMLLQRCAAILHFFNPAIWIANGLINQLREYTCDDMAISLSDASGLESGEAFVRILRHADRGRRGLKGALGMFELDARATCLRRVRRLLDTERPIHTALGAWSLWGLILLAVVSIPRLSVISEAIADIPDAPAASSEVPAARAQDFELHVVGPDGKAVPEAVVQLRADSLPTAQQIRKGKFIRQQSYGIFVATDALGRLVVELPHAPERFDVFITIPGYGPYWAGWSSETHAQSIPRRFSAELEAAWSMGGIVVDVDGKPVENADVWPSIEFKKRPGEVRQMGIGARVKTNTAGKWRFDSVPVSLSDVQVNIDHSGFRPNRRQLGRREFGIDRDREPTSQIVMDRGLTVTGKVTDDAGQPIVGALVRTKFINDVREAKTGHDGVYILAGCEPRSVRLVVSAKGRATDVKELNIEPGMGTVDFRMKLGGTVHIRVLDERGNPVPKARIFFQQWRRQFQHFEFDSVKQYTDDMGAWVWREAPLDEFLADICPPVGMQLRAQALIARDEEYVFRVPGPLVVSGKVIDAVTRQPVKTFRVVPGGRYDRGDVFWNWRESFIASDGRYEIRQTRADSANMILIEADGYLSPVSREIKSTEESVAIDFALQRGQGVVARVMTPRNQSAVGAKVALSSEGSRIHIKNGDINDVSTYCALAETDHSGRFHFPAQDKDFQLVITHPSGFAFIKSAPEWELTRIIHLEPWSRVEGTFRVGKTPAAHLDIKIDVRQPHFGGAKGPRIDTQHQSDIDGHFAFERVIPGSGRIGRRITFTDEGATEIASTFTIGANFLAGETAHIDLGGTGRQVVGKLQPPVGTTKKVRWNFAIITVKSDNPAARPDQPYFTVTVDRDGRFRIDDVPAGNYSLSVRFMRDDVRQLRNQRFVVPSGEGDRAEQPLDLGVLTLVNP